MENKDNIRTSKEWMDLDAEATGSSSTTAVDDNTTQSTDTTSTTIASPSNTSNDDTSAANQRDYTNLSYSVSPASLMGTLDKTFNVEQSKVSIKYYKVSKTVDQGEIHLHFFRSLSSNPFFNSRNRIFED